MDVDLLEKFLEENGGTSELLRHIPPKEITLNRLQDISRRVGEEGTFLVIAHHGTLTNAMAGNNDIVKEAVNVIHKSLKMLVKDLSLHKTDVEKFSPEEMLTLRRALAVHVYLVHKALGGMESKAVHESNNSTSFIAPGGKKGRGGKNASASRSKRDSGGLSQSWDSRRTLLIEDLLAVMECPVDKIWDDDVACGFSLPRLLIRTMCTNLNETFLAKENLKAGPEAYKILGILAKRFGKQEDVLSRVVPFVKVNEDVAKIVARVLDILVNEFELVESVPLAMRQALELCMDMNMKDLNAEKGFAAFILELCQLVPEQVIVKGSNTLIDFLEADSNAVRSAVLTGASILLKWLNAKKGGGPGGRMMRNCFIERIILLHSKDTNAIVRAKSLKLLTDLISNDELEPTEVAVCLAGLKPRLMDKAVSVRKNACAMLGSILEHFPVIVKTDSKYREEVDAARKKVLELLAKKNPRKSHYIFGLVREFLDQVHHYPIPLPEQFEPLENMAGVRTLITKLVTEEKYWDACTVLYHTFDRFGNAAGFGNVAEMTGVANIYLSYFNLSAEIDSQNSSLEQSLNMSQSQSSSSKSGNGYMEPDEVIHEKKQLHFFQGCEKMTRLIPEIINSISALLDCGSETDRSEMINLVGLFVRCGYKIQNKLTASVIKAISQIQNESAGDILPAFWSIFIGDTDIGNVPLVKSLFSILSTVTPTVKEHLKPIIAEMYKSRKFPHPVIMIFWDAFTKMHGLWDDVDARNAIFVLGIIGSCDRTKILQNLQIIIDTALTGEGATERMSLIKHTLEALLLSFKRSKKGESDIKDTTRFEADHVLFDRLISLLEWGVTHTGNIETDYNFPQVAELSVQIIYRLSLAPQNLIKKLLNSIPILVFGDGKTPSTSEIKDTERLHIRYLSLLRSLLGGHINYHENVVFPELKRRKALTMKDQVGGEKSSKGSKGKKGTASESSRNTSTRSSGPDLSRSSRSNISISSTASRQTNTSVNTTNNEMDVMIGSVGYDNEQEIIRTFIEKILDSGVFRHFRILTLNFCRNIGKQKSLKLQIECVKSLAKIMSVSSDSVSKHMEIFLNLWSIATSPLVKIEIIKQCTVLNIRFPNQMEDCNKVVQLGLRGEDNMVKVACLDFMTYLALGDMVKVRDYIADVAILLCDVSQQVRDMAKDFFNVCADKDNVMSNAVPEVISRLSIKQDLTQRAFQDIMKFLLVRVTKEKQVIGLVDKLILRFKGPSGNERSWQDTAFCLGQLPHPEKSLKLLKDHFTNYSDKLYDDIIYQSFLDICETLRRIEKPEFGGKIEDYEKELVEAREKCLENKRIEKVAGRQKRGGKNDSSLMEGGRDEESEDDKMEEEQENENEEMEEEQVDEEMEQGDEAETVVKIEKGVTSKIVSKKVGNGKKKISRDEEDKEESEPETVGRRSSRRLNMSKAVVVAVSNKNKGKKISKEEEEDDEQPSMVRRSSRILNVSLAVSNKDKGKKLTKDKKNKVIKDEPLSEEDEEVIEGKDVEFSEDEENSDKEDEKSSEDDEKSSGDEEKEEIEETSDISSSEQELSPSPVRSQRSTRRKN